MSASQSTLHLRPDLVVRRGPDARYRVAEASVACSGDLTMTPGRHHHARDDSGCGFADMSTWHAVSLRSLPSGKHLMLDRNADIGAISKGARQFAATLAAMKQELASAEFAWYPYGTLYNFDHFTRLLKGDSRKLFELIGDGRFVDIGAADGDAAYFLERCGFCSRRRACDASSSVQVGMSWTG